MSQVIQRDMTFGSLSSHSAPINKLPIEALMHIFKTYAESYPEDLDQRVVDLCLVGRHWKAVASSTPQLWTKINLSFPFSSHHLAAALKRVRASRLQEIDVSIDFRDPDWDGDEPDFDDEDTYIPGDHVWVRGIMAVLNGTEGRWRSIKVVSDDWVPLYELMDNWRRFTHLSSLESISMKRANTMFGMRNMPFDPQLLIETGTLFDRNVSLPRLRDLSLSAVHIDWNDAYTGYQNLRKLEINNQPYDVGPSYEEFAAILSSSPRLEYLDVSGFCPDDHTGVPPFPVVHLPALKELVFGWKEIGLGCNFLSMFQIGDSLESLTLLDTESGFGYWVDRQTGGRGWREESGEIFETICDLGSAVPEDMDDAPFAPFISMRRVKRLRILWTKAASPSLIPFLAIFTGLEEVWLEDVDEGVLQGVTVSFSSVEEHRPVKRLDFRWKWEQRVPDFAEPLIPRFEREGVHVVAQAGEDWRVGPGQL